MAETMLQWMISIGLWQFPPTHPLRAWRCWAMRWMLAFVLLCLAIGWAFAQDGAHGDGHAEQHDIYKDWTVPKNPNSSCCHDKDCRPTRAYVDGEGRWHAWNGSTWLPVPGDRLLPTDFAGDGRNHLCEKGGTIYCFTPSEPKS